MVGEWQHMPDGAWFYEEPGVVWANITAHHGAFVCAFVQQTGRGCHTGSFDTVAQAKSWARNIITATTATVEGATSSTR